MAVRKREGRRLPYQAYWINPFTKKRETASFATKEEALKEDTLVKHRLKFDRESFRPEVIEEEENEAQDLTLEQACFLYLKERQFSRNGLRWQLKGLRPLLLLYGTAPVREFGAEEIKRVINALNAESVKQITRHGKLSVIKTFIKWCADNEYCEPVSFPKFPKGHYEKFVPPTPEELSAMLAVASQHIQRVIILGSQCGLRIGTSELFKLTWHDVDFGQSLIRVQAAHKNPSAPWREIPLRESLKKIMAEWREEDMAQKTLFLINYEGKPVTTIKRAWQAMLKRAGITRRIRPYDLRHAFATELIANGVDIGTIAKLMGHSSPNMIYQHYQFVMDKQKKAAVESLPEIDYVPNKMCPNKKGFTLIQ